jgi:hypothetical protein
MATMRNRKKERKKMERRRKKKRENEPKNDHKQRTLLVHRQAIQQWAFEKEKIREEEEE